MARLKAKRFSLIRLALIVLALAGGVSARAAEPSCEDVFATAEGHSIHPAVTARGYFWIRGLLTQQLGAAEALRTPNGPIPAYREAAVLNGEASLLSLGEGDSGFVSTLIRLSQLRRMKFFGFVDHIHAVDYSYMPDASDYVRRQLSTGASLRLWSLPRNYHGQLFQELDLKSADGSRRRFDEIVSSHSLVYLLSSFHDRPEQERILSRVFEHLAPGGVFRAWGMADEHSGEPSGYIRGLLERTPGDWGLERYSVGEFLDSGWKAVYVMLQKKP